MSEDPANVVETLIANLKAVLTVNYIAVALLTIMVYDTILTIPQEVKFVWETRDISFRKILYIVTRYYAFISLAVIVQEFLGRNLTIKVCRVYTQWFSSAGLPIEEALVNLLLILRINALYGGQKKVLYFILVLYFIELVLFFYTATRTGKAVPLTPLPVGLSLPGCLIYTTGRPNFTFTLLAWVPAFVFSAILLAFSIYKVREDLVSEPSGPGGFTSLTLHHPLLLAIFQQGIIFFIVNTVITLLNAAFVIKIHAALDIVAVPLGILAYSLCGCRFLLSFHKLSDKSDNVVRGVRETDGVVVFHNDTTNESYVLNAL